MIQDLHSGRLTRNPRRSSSKRTAVYKVPLIRLQVSFPECTLWLRPRVRVICEAEPSGVVDDGVTHGKHSEAAPLPCLLQRRGREGSPNYQVRIYTYFICILYTYMYVYIYTHYIYVLHIYIYFIWDPSISLRPQHLRLQRHGIRKE